jgi:hypothetical protein
MGFDPQFPFALLFFPTILIEMNRSIFVDLNCIFHDFNIKPHVGALLNYNMVFTALN